MVSADACDVQLVTDTPTATDNATATNAALILPFLELTSSSPFLNPLSPLTFEGPCGADAVIQQPEANLRVGYLLDQLVKL
jgi:hypothetical protein